MRLALTNSSTANVTVQFIVHISDLLQGVDSKYYLENVSIYEEINKFQRVVLRYILNGTLGNNSVPRYI